MLASALRFFPGASGPREESECKVLRQNRSCRRLGRFSLELLGGLDARRQFSIPPYAKRASLSFGLLSFFRSSGRCQRTGRIRKFRVAETLP